MLAEIGGNQNLKCTVSQWRDVDADSTLALRPALDLFSPRTLEFNLCGVISEDRSPVFEEEPFAPGAAVR